MRWFKHLIRVLPGCVPVEVSGYVQLEGDCREDPEPAGQITYFIWPGTFSDPQEELQSAAVKKNM